MARPPTLDPSYRALLTVPSLGQVLLSMQIARIAQSMIAIVTILFALRYYGSTAIAGMAAFAATAPGVIVSPVAGALLDRHGRVRLIILDYVVAAAAIALIAALALGGALPAWLLILVTALGSITGPLSGSGLRSLFPLIVPRHLWERVNALDSNGWVVASIVGTPAGAVAFQLLGPVPTMLAIAAAFLIAAVVIRGAPDPRPDVASTGNLARDAWLGLVYTARNPTLRALAISLSTLNLGWGVMQIVVPAIVLRRLHMGDDVVGLLFAVGGGLGGLAAIVFGRLRTEGRERAMIVLPSLGVALGTLVIFLPGGLLPLVVAMAVIGFLNGPMDIALFTVRQRRTDPAWMGRAFTVSMSLNFSGFPIGAAIGGAIAEQSIEGAIWVAFAAAAVATALCWWLLPGSDEPARESAPERESAPAPERALDGPPERAPEPAVRPAGLDDC